MAYNQTEDGDFYVGTLVSRAGYDDEDVVTPTWDSLLDMIENEEKESADILVIGKNYDGHDRVGGMTLHMPDTEELYRVPNPGESIHRRVSTPDFVQRLFRLPDRPRQIAAIVVRRLR